MTQVTITDRERYLLNLIAAGESSSRGGDPYCSIYPNQYEPRLVSMTLEQVLQFQSYRTTSRSSGGLGIASSACGRYQFIRRTLEGIIQSTGISRSTRYSPDIQDYLILEVLRRSRGLDSWLSGSLPDESFQLNLAREFASVPVPFDTQGQNRRVRRGETYYAGDRLNAAHHNPDVFIQNLRDIRRGGPGNTTSVDLMASGDPYSPSGNLLTTQVGVSAAGGQGLVGGIGGEQPLPRTSLPAASNPYAYRRPDPLDNRYDFRTGQAVRELLINGTNPVAANALIPGNGRPPPVDIGSGGYTPEQEQGAVDQRPPSVGYDTGQVDPRLAAAAARSTGSGTTPPARPAPPPEPTTPPSDTINGGSLVVPRQVRTLLA
jgi:hypothetical protein